MSSEPIIRPVRTEDAADLRENCFSRNALEEVQEQVADAIRTAEQGTQVLLGAEVEGRVVGTGAVVRKTHPFYAHRAAVGGLVVHPRYQRQGIARQIVDQIRALAATMDLEILEVGCRGGTPAEAVYRHLGFVECGRLPGGIVEPYEGGQTYDEVSFYMPVRRDEL